MSANYAIDCTGDAVAGDRVQFTRAVFEGSYRRPVFVENEVIRAEILRDSYGAGRQQHTFTMLSEDGITFRIKGRNLYRNGTRRMRWADESKRRAAADEKHNRGDDARHERDRRQKGQDL